jgi:hypothetical protein
MAELRNNGEQRTPERLASDSPFAERSPRDDFKTEGFERSGRTSGYQVRDGEDAQAFAVASPPSNSPESLAQHTAGGAAPLLSEPEIGDLRSRWNNIQAEFVDEPRQAVAQADQLVAIAIERLADGFAKERASLEKQWESGKDASTEDLRLALQRYRAFFGRLLNAA